MDWLKTTGLVYWRQNSGFVPVRGGKGRIRLGASGLPDICVVCAPTGRFLGLEVKTAYGKIRPSQLEFAEKSQNAGAHYFIVRSLADARTVVEKVLALEKRIKEKLNGG